MMKHFLQKFSLLGAAALFVLAMATPSQAWAHAIDPEERQTATRQSEDMPTTAQTDRREAAKTRLEGARLRACQARTKTVTNLMSRIASRGQKQLDLFTAIAQRTQNFYEKSGKTLSNYDELVAEVTTKKAAAQEAVTAVKNSTTQFDCDGDDPKGTASHFKEHMQAQNEALKAYKTAVKNLIAGVKSVQSRGGTQ